MTIKEKIVKLMNVKSIVTILLAVVFAALALLGRVTAEQFITIFTVIISFYFGTQAKKE